MRSDNSTLVKLSGATVAAVCIMLGTAAAMAADPAKQAPAAPAAKAPPAAAPAAPAKAEAAAPAEESAPVAPAEAAAAPAEVPATDPGAAAAETGVGEQPAAADAPEAAPAAADPVVAPKATPPSGKEATAPATAPAQGASSAQHSGGVGDLNVGSVVVGTDGVKIGELNRVKSDASGKVIEIHVTNGVPAGLGVPVVAIPAAKITSGGRDVKVSLSSAEAKKLPILKDDKS